MLLKLLTSWDNYPVNTFQSKENLLKILSVISYQVAMKLIKNQNKMTIDWFKEFSPVLINLNPNIKSFAKSKTKSY